MTATPVSSCELPAGALLASYRDAGAFTDCRVTRLPQSVSQQDFVRAFYTTWVFKVERALLGWFARRASTDEQADALAVGTAGTFAAWRVEARQADQILLCDFLGRTRSWLMTVPDAGGTALYFGSAVVPVRDKRSGGLRLGWTFHSLLGFHALYSRVLLGAAARRLSA